MNREEMIRKLSVISISEDYADGKDTIHDLIDKFNDTIKSVNEVDKTYNDLVSNYLCKIYTLCDILCLKRIKNNREDGLVLIELLEQLIGELKYVMREVKVYVTTSK